MIIGVCYWWFVLFSFGYNLWFGSDIGCFGDWWRIIIVWKWLGCDLVGLVWLVYWLVGFVGFWYCCDVFVCCWLLVVMVVVWCLVYLDWILLDWWWLLLVFGFCCCVLVVGCWILYWVDYYVCCIGVYVVGVDVRILGCVGWLFRFGYCVLLLCCLLILVVGFGLCWFVYVGLCLSYFMYSVLVCFCGLVIGGLGCFR